MKYRILIKAVNTNAASLNWFTGSAGNAPWETDNEQEALQKYQYLLNTHPADNLTLIQAVPVNIDVTA